MCVWLQVVETEKEKRESENEHRRVLDQCTAVLDEYRTIERRLRPYIVKSRPYYEQRWKSSQRLGVSVSELCATSCACTPPCSVTVGDQEPHH